MRSAQTRDALEIPDPASPASIVGHAASASPKDVEDAVAAANAAFPAWSALTAQERAAKMAEAIAGIADDRDEDAAILSQENGKIRIEGWIDALVFEIRWQLALMLADEVDTGKVLEPAPGIPVRTEVAYQPLGVVTVIVPFNWPIAILGASLPHALLAGNTAIVKPPPSAPLATTRVVQRVAEKLPPGVLNVVTGKDENMAGPDPEHRHREGVLHRQRQRRQADHGDGVEDPHPRHARARRQRRGGLPRRRDPRRHAPRPPVRGDLRHHRADLHERQARVRAPLPPRRARRRAAARLERAKLGHGLDEGTTMGPLHSPAQKAFVEEIIQEAKDAGADVREFGDLPGGDLAGGNFLRPALVVDPDPALRVVTQEQFGPVIPILPFDTEEEAVRLANDTWGGLCGSVWTADPEAASRIGSQLVCGYVWVNDHGATRLDLRAPFGGMKQSGIGREQGIEGVRAFQDTRSIATIDAEALAAMAH